MPVFYYLTTLENKRILISKRSALPTGRAYPDRLQVDWSMADEIEQGSHGKVCDLELKSSKIKINFPQMVVKYGECSKSEQSFLKKEADFFRQVHGGPVFLKFSKGRYYFLAKRIFGLSLAECLLKVGFTLEQKFKLVLAVIDAVEKLHQQCIIHGDLNVYNILVSLTSESSFEVRLIDFGFASCLGEEARTANIDPSKSRYTHPELCSPKEIPS